MNRTYASLISCALIALLLLPVGGWGATRTWDGGADGNLNNGTNYDPDGAIDPGDDIVISSTSTAITATDNLTCNSFVTTSGYSGNLSLATYKIIAATKVKIDGTGTLNLGKGVTWGADTFHVGAGVGTITAAACTSTVADGVTGYWDPDKNLSSAQIKVGDASTFNHVGNATQDVLSGVAPVKFGNGGTLGIFKNLNLYRSTSGQMIDVVAGTPVVTGIGPLGFYTNGSGVSDTIPGLVYGITGITNISNIPNAATSMCLGGNAKFAEVRAFENNRGASASFTFCMSGYDFTATDFCWGSQGQQFNLILDGATLRVNRCNDNIKYVAGPSSDNFGTSTIFDTARFNIPANHTVTPGTSLLNFCGSGLQVCSLATPTAQHFYDLTKSGSGQLYFGTDVYIDGDMTATDGTVNLAGHKMVNSGDNLIDCDSLIASTAGSRDSIIGNSAQFHIGSGVAVNAPALSIYWGETGQVWDDDRAAVLQSFVVNGGVTSSGAGQTSLSGTTTPFTVLAGSHFTNNVSNLIIRPTGSTPAYSIAADAIIDGTGIYFIQAHNSGIAITLPALAITGTAGLMINSTSSAGGALSMTHTGNISCLGAVSIYQIQAGSNMTYKTAGYSLTCGSFNYGSNASAVWNGNFNTGSVVSVTGAVNGTVYNSGTIAVNDSAQWAVGGNVTLLSNATRTIGPTQSFTLNGSGVQTVTSNGKQIADSMAVTGSGTVTAADSLYARAIRIASGTLALGTNALRVNKLHEEAAADMSWSTGAKLYITASGKVTGFDGDTLPPTTFLGSGGL